jgi:hypothetical protein
MHSQPMLTLISRDKIKWAQVIEVASFAADIYALVVSSASQQ